MLPRPGFPLYEIKAAYSNLEVRHYDLLPEKGWEVDLEAVEALSDENTVAMVVINPGNPCGNVHSAQHLEKVTFTTCSLFLANHNVYSRVHVHIVHGTIISRYTFCLGMQDLMNHYLPVN